MPEPITIIAGHGALPGIVLRHLQGEGVPAMVVAIAGFHPADVVVEEELRVERLVPFLESLRARGIARVTFAGATARPQLDPALFDPQTAALLPRFVPALTAGDDSLLREVIKLFEENGLEVLGAADLVPDLVPAPGVLGYHQPDAAAKRDAARAAEIVAALGAIDVGQGAVVARGQCLGLEALAGTDAMLACIAAQRDKGAIPGAGHRGLLYKAPKPGQDRRIDLPALGPDSVRAAAAAGLSGIAFEAGGVMLLERAEMVAEADRAGLFLWARAR